MSSKVEYNKNPEKVDVGTKLFHKQLGDVYVVSCYDDSIKCIIVQDNKELPFRWSDMGKVLFFSDDDYKTEGTNSFQAKYAAYKNVETQTDVKKNIEKENAEFFNGMYYHDKELYVERQFFDRIKKALKTDLDDQKNEEQGLYLVNNGNSESYDPDIARRRRENHIKVEAQTTVYNEPYFAKIQIKGEAAVYLGKAKVGTDVIDSRDKKYGPLYYEWIYHKQQLDLVRQFMIRSAKLKDFEDLYNLLSDDEPAILDEFLARIIKYNRGQNDIVNIAQSIQVEQYKIISRPYSENLLVEGCAGSGKTMILLHRLSSIIFNESDTFKTSDFILISPNNVLDRQSESLLAELDLSKTTKGSIRSLYIKWIREYIREFEVTIGEYFTLDKPVYDNTQTFGDVINVLYQEDIANDFDEILCDVVENPFSITKGFNFINEEKVRIAKHKENVYGGDIPDGDRLWGMFKDIANEYNSICATLSRDNVVEKMKSISERGQALKKSLKSFDNETLESIKSEYSSKVKEIEQTIDTKKAELSDLFAKIAEISDGESTFEKMMARENKDYYNAQIDILADEFAGLRRELAKVNKERDSKTKEIIDDHELNILRKQYISLKVFLDTNDLKGSPEKNKNGKLSLADQLYRSAYEFYEKVEPIIPSEIINLNNSLSKFLHNNYILVDRISRYERFLAGNKKAYLIDLIECILCFHKKVFDVSTTDFYEFELYYLLRGLQLQCGVLDDRKKLVSVDEYQDYSPIEIELIEKIFPQAVMNLYGEILQNINEKGVTDINNKHYSKCNIYKLDTNYRNGKEITQYLNDTFNTKMKPIGISSTVNDVAVNKLDELTYDGKKRVALIIKSFDEYSELSYDKFNDNVFINDETEIDREKLNVIPIKLAKGLEFETVYVYNKNMTKNEKYVACSRALEELNIIA